MATAVNKPPVTVTVVIVVIAVVVTSLVINPFDTGVGGFLLSLVMAVAITLVLHAIYWAITGRRT